MASCPLTDAAKAYRQGLKLCREGAHAKALNFLDVAISVRTDCSHYFAARANCKQALNQHLEAYHDYVSAIHVNCTKPTYFSCRGLCLMKIGKAEAALSDFSRACELEPNAAIFHYQKAALLHHHLGRPREAVTSYAACIANAGPADRVMALRCLHAKGACLFEDGRALEAVADLTRAAELSEPSPAALHYLAKALRVVGRSERALAVLGEALEKYELTKESHDCRHAVYFDRGVVRLEQGNDEGALEDFDKAVALSGVERGGYFVQRARARARVAMRSQGRQEALAGVQDIEKAMELEPDNPEFLFTAGVLCSRMGEFDRALPHLERLAAIFDKAGGRRSSQDFCLIWLVHAAATPAPRVAMFHDLCGVSSEGANSTEREDVVAGPAACEFERALCLYKLQRYQEALRLAQRALASGYSEDAQRFQLRGLILHDLHRYDEAVKDFTASIAVSGRRPQGFLLRGRSLAGLGKHEQAVTDFTVAIEILERRDSADDGGLISTATRRSPQHDGRQTPRSEGAAEVKTEHPRGFAPGGGEEISSQAEERWGRDDGGKTGKLDGGDGMGERGSVVGACFYARALSLHRLKRFADAAIDFDSAVAEGPTSWQRLWHRALCLTELGGPFRARAAEDLRACVSLAQKEESSEVLRAFHFQVGLAFLHLGDKISALGYLDRAAAAGAAAHSCKQTGNPSRRNHDAPEPGREHRRPLLSSPEQPKASQEDFNAALQYHRGVCLMDAEELELAEAAFSVGVELGEGLARTRTSGKRQTALSSQLQDDTRMHAACYRERGRARQLLRDPWGARSDFTACLELLSPTANNDAPGECGSSGIARMLFLRAWAHKAVGDLASAAADFEAARSLDPLQPHLSVDYRNIFDVELVVTDDIEPMLRAPAMFHRE